jgi:hypothetical protein
MKVTFTGNFHITGTRTLSDEKQTTKANWKATNSALYHSQLPSHFLQLQEFVWYNHEGDLSLCRFGDEVVGRFLRDLVLTTSCFFNSFYKLKTLQLEILGRA